MSVLDYSPLSKVEPEKSLLAPLKKNAGRNSYGRITVRHRGGGNRRKYRIIDFKRNKADIPAKVLTLEYDPNRSAHIALVQYEDGEKRYILAPQGLKASLITGGLPGLVHVDDIYRLTYERTAARNRAYFQRHPGDERTVRELCAHLADTEETLPTGERLSPARLRMIGMMLGGQGNTDQLHYLLEGPWTSVRGQRRLSSQFLAAIGSQVDVAPIYAVFQEYIYACATPDLVGTATGWAADRLAEEVPGFAKDADPLDDKEPFYLTGEHFMRRVFDEDPGLAPLKGVAEILASTTEAAPVYLPDVLAQNTVPVAAAVYYDDMFVPRELSLDTGDLIGARHYITNEYQHDGSAYSGGAVVSHLLDLLAD